MIKLELIVGMECEGLPGNAMRCIVISKLRERESDCTSRKYSRFNAPIFISRIAGGIMDSVNRPRELLISDCGRALVAFVAKIIVRTSPAASSPLLISPFPTIRHPSTF